MSTGAGGTSGTDRRRRRRRLLGRPLLAVVSIAALALLAAACTPAQFQAWWTAQGNTALSEPELSRAAAAATAHWDEQARRQRFVWASSPITAQLAERMTPTSWRPGCPVGLASLRYVQVAHMGFDGREHIGELVVRDHDVTAVAIAFKLLWDAGFPIERMRLVDDYGGDDDTSMAANNTSAFNCRTAAGSSTWSQHAYGRAIDINPVQNPSVTAGVAAPPSGAAFVDRARIRPGMLVEGGAAVDAFDRIGWGWGGRWNSSKDYQHLSATGR